MTKDSIFPKSLTSIIDKYFKVLFTILFTLFIFEIVSVLYKQNPFDVLVSFLKGSCGNWYSIGQTLFKATPLIFTGLSVGIAFRAGLFNLGAEGQAIVGSFVMAIVGANLPAFTPSFIAIPICIISAGIAGAVWAGIIALLKIKYDAHEVITTIMMNFISAALVGWLVNDYFSVVETVHTKPIIEQAFLPKFADFFSIMKGSSFNTSIFIAIFVVICMHILIERTILGYKIKVVGLSQLVSSTSGISYKHTIFTTMILSGFLSGMAGISSVLGYKHYHEENLNSGIGFLGIAVALIGKGKPLQILFAAIFLGLLSQGGLSINAIIPKDVVELLYASILLCLSVVP